MPPDEVVTPAPAVPVVAPAVTPPAPVVPPAPASATDPAWLPGRIEQAKRSAEADLLKSIGFETPEAAKAAGAAAKAAADANKSAETRATEATAAVAVEKARADKLAAITTEHAARQMVGLTEPQRAAVKAIAGEDAAEQLRAIGALTPTWAAAGAPVVPTAAPTTVPATGAPSGTLPVPQTAAAQYEALAKVNPFAAASFGASHPDAYKPAGAA